MICVIHDYNNNMKLLFIAYLLIMAWGIDGYPSLPVFLEHMAAVIVVVPLLMLACFRSN